MANQTYDERCKALKGRVAWMLRELERVGWRGLTSRAYPGARISRYMLKLREAGFAVETIRKAHGGPFEGSHGRFRLISKSSEVAA